jgi:protein-tyrosine phosphatase
VGGDPTGDGGRVRTGLLYRSGALQRLADEDLEAFTALGIRRVYDLRGEHERQAGPDRMPSGAVQVVADVLVDWVDGGPNRVFALFEDPEAARRELADGGVRELWIEQYRKQVTLRSARTAYGRVFRDLAQPGHRPGLIHCSGGKDRTGWAVAALLLLLGVSTETVMAEFLRTGDQGETFGRAALEALRERGGDPDLWRPMFASDPIYLEAGLAEVASSFGSLEGYFADGLGIDADTQEALRTAFVDR